MTAYGSRLAPDSFFAADPALFEESKDHAALIESLLQEHKAISVPALSHPVELNRPIRLSSGMHLRIHESTVLRMQESCGGCMVRNENVVSGVEGPAASPVLDKDITIEGGQWENAPRTASVNDPSPVIREFGERGLLLGMIFFCHAERVTVRNITVRKSDMYGVLIADCSDFLIENITFDDHHKDGVHVNGPAYHGLIQNMQGTCGDDFVALNAWDWDTSSVSFGPIEEITVRHIACQHDEMRILPGRKTYPGGQKIDCPVRNCSFSDISGAYNFKMYQQPNCHNLKRAVKDFSEIAGLIENVSFSDIRLDSLTADGLAEVRLDAIFEMGADCRSISFERLSFGFSMEEFRKKNMSLAVIGPKSSTWTRGSADPNEWTELFEPDLIVTAQNISFDEIRFADGACAERKLLLREQHLSVNPDYPNTTPRGGTGYGVADGMTVGAAKRSVLPEEAEEAAKDCGQLIFVRHLAGSRAYFTYFRKEGADWARVFSCMANIGKNGVGKEKEGDMKTPLGTFNLSTPFGILPDPSLDDPLGRRAENYLQLTEAHYWCGQSGPFYNRLIDNSNPPAGYVPNGDDEHLIRYRPSYHYSMFIDYNREGRAHLGSCIFLHCTSSSPHTAGCVAIEERYMRELILELKAGAKIVICRA